MAVNVFTVEGVLTGIREPVDGAKGPAAHRRAMVDIGDDVTPRKVVPFEFGPKCAIPSDAVKGDALRIQFRIGRVCRPDESRSGGLKTYNVVRLKAVKAEVIYSARRAAEAAKKSEVEELVREITKGK